MQLDVPNNLRLDDRIGLVSFRRSPLAGDSRLDRPQAGSYKSERKLAFGMLVIGIVLTLGGCTTRQVRGDAAVDTQAPSSPTEKLDPWEPTNRRIHAFNRELDRYVMKPVARTWLRVPKPIRQGVGNVFDNLQEPVVSLNLLAQGEPHKSWQSVVRFLLNSTFGVAGIFDVAAAGGVPEYRGDFGQTFARWGWEPSRYVVMPVFGPSSVRDGLARLINSQVSPINKVGQEVGPGFGLLYGVISRANALPNEAFTENAADEYLLLRDVYYQRRGCQIRDCTEDMPDYELPEELGIPDDD